MFGVTNKYATSFLSQAPAPPSRAALDLNACARKPVGNIIEYCSTYGPMTFYSTLWSRFLSLQPKGFFYCSFSWEDFYNFICISCHSMQVLQWPSAYCHGRIRCSRCAWAGRNGHIQCRRSSACIPAYGLALPSRQAAEQWKER